MTTFAEGAETLDTRPPVHEERTLELSVRFCWACGAHPCERATSGRLFLFCVICRANARYAESA